MCSSDLVDEIHSLEDLEPWLKVIKENEPDVVPMYLTSSYSAPTYMDLIQNPVGIEYGDESLTVQNVFEIPENWEWVRLGNIVSVYGGKRIPAGRKLTELDTGHKYIRVSDMKNGSVNLDDIKYLEEDIYQKAHRPGDRRHLRQLRQVSRRPT